MKIGFIGYGSMADALGSKWAGKHELFIGGRNTDKASALAEQLGHGAESGTTEESVRFGELVVIAVDHDAVSNVLESVDASAFAGKIVLDINNPIDARTFLPKEEFAPSMGEYIAERLPDAHVVKAFNMCHADVWKMADPVLDGRRLVAMFCGNHDAAKEKVVALIRDTGCEPLDLGGIEKSRLLEPAADIVIQMLFAGRDKRTVLNLVQPEVKSP